LAVIDASVYVAIAHAADRFHARCLDWLEARLRAGDSLIAPTLLVVEVAAAIRRLTGERRLADRVVADLYEAAVIELLPLTVERSRHAARTATRAAVRGADALYLALASELDEPLVTLDRQQLRRGATVARVERP
jgi:predicted nucleic acid-binding protein